MIHLDTLLAGNVHLHQQQPIVVIGLAQALERERAMGIPGSSSDPIGRILQKPAHRCVFYSCLLDIPINTHLPTSAAPIPLDAPNTKSIVSFILLLLNGDLGERLITAFNFDNRQLCAGESIQLATGRYETLRSRPYQCVIVSFLHVLKPTTQGDKGDLLLDKTCADAP